MLVCLLFIPFLPAVYADQGSLLSTPHYHQPLPHCTFLPLHTPLCILHALSYLHCPFLALHCTVMLIIIMYLSLSLRIATGRVDNPAVLLFHVFFTLFIFGELPSSYALFINRATGDHAVPPVLISLQLAYPRQSTRGRTPRTKLFCH